MCHNQQNVPWTVGGENGYWFEYLGIPSNILPVTIVANPDLDKQFKFNVYEEFASLAKYLGDESTVIVPAAVDGKPVTDIGVSAFENNKALQCVVLPESVETIQRNAFAGCAALESVSFPDGLIALYDGAFADCVKLESIAFSPRLEIGDGSVFAGCSALKTAYFSGSVSRRAQMALPSDFLAGVSYKFNHQHAHNEALTLPASCTKEGAELLACACGSCPRGCVKGKRNPRRLHESGQL